MRVVLFIFLFFSFTIKAQDTLLLKDSTKIVSLVLMHDVEQIRYKKIDNITGPDLYIENSKVNTVKYKNGNIINVDSLYQIYLKEKGGSQNKLVQGVDQSSGQDMYNMGMFHAEVNYQCKGCTAGFMAMGLLIGPFSVIPGLGTMFVTPGNSHLAYPNEELWINKDYQRGYKDKARKIKRRAIGTGLWIGNSLSVFGWGIILTALQKNNP